LPQHQQARDQGGEYAQHEDLHGSFAIRQWKLAATLTAARGRGKRARPTVLRQAGCASAGALSRGSSAPA
jgi:tRNA(Met) C34 N-acetyltransferase TmcA